MLTVQRVNVNPAFQSRRNNDKLDPRTEQMKLEWEGYRDEFEGLENDDNLPSPVRKFAKFMKVVSGGVVTGLGVVWASKKAGNLSRKALNSKAVKNAKKEAGKLCNAIKEPTTKIAGKIKAFFAEKMTKLLEKEKMQKLIAKMKAFKETKFGKFLTKAEYRIKRDYRFVRLKLNTMLGNAKKSVSFKKVNDTTANVMGTGSGIAAGYELAKEEGNE